MAKLIDLTGRRFSGKIVHLGMFDSAEEASLEYQKAKREKLARLVGKS